MLTGQLFLDEGDRDGLRIKMRVAEDALTLSTDDGVLGSWTPLATEVEEVGSERFKLAFGSETVVFAPDDPVEFRYEIAPDLGERETRKSRRAAKKARKGLKAVVVPAPQEPERAWEVDAPVPSTQKMDEFLELFKELAAVQNQAPVAEPRVADTPVPEPDPYDVAEEPSVAEPTGTRVVEPTPHEPLVAPQSVPQEPQATPATTPSSRPQPRPARPDKDEKASSPTPINADEPTSPTIISSAEKGLAGAGQAAAASLEKAKAAPAALSEGVRRLFVKAEVEEHRHRFESNGIPGGLVRHICADCGHVSVDLRDETAEKALENSLFQRRIRM